MKRIVSIVVVVIALLSITISASDVSVASLNSSCAVDGVATYYAVGYQYGVNGASIEAGTTFTGCNAANSLHNFTIKAKASCYYYNDTAPYTYYTISGPLAEDPNGGISVYSSRSLIGGQFLKTVGNIYESYCPVCKLGESGNMPGTIY